MKRIAGTLHKGVCAFMTMFPSNLTINFSDKNCSENRNTHFIFSTFNPLNPKLNPICRLLALLGAHHILRVSGLRVKENFFLYGIMFENTCKTLPDMTPMTML